MPALSDTQARFRDVVAGRSARCISDGLRAAGDTSERLEIYRRHYRESFRRHFRGRYPTVEWLLGTDRFVMVADLTLQLSPPLAPCLSEYGAELAETIDAHGGDLPPYIADVARVDWSLGCLSVAIAHDPIPLAALSSVAPHELPSLRLFLQPGVAYMNTAWPVDDLIHLRLQDSQPAEFVLEAAAARLQLRGARGQFSLQRLTPGAFAFRAGLARGETLGAAAFEAAEAEPEFDLSAALAAIFAEGLIIQHSGETTDV